MFKLSHAFSRWVESTKLSTETQGQSPTTQQHHFQEMGFTVLKKKQKNMGPQPIMSLSLWESGGLAPVPDHRHHSSSFDSLKTVPEAQ